MCIDLCTVFIYVFKIIRDALDFVQEVVPLLKKWNNNLPVQQDGRRTGAVKSVLNNYALLYFLKTAFTRSFIQRKRSDHAFDEFYKKSVEDSQDLTDAPLCCLGNRNAKQKLDAMNATPVAKALLPEVHKLLKFIV